MKMERSEFSCAELKKAFIHIHTEFLIPGIKRAFVNTEKDSAGRIVIVTEGINILEVWKHHEIVDTSDLYTNDINTLVLHFF